MFAAEILRGTRAVDAQSALRPPSLEENGYRTTSIGARMTAQPSSLRRSIRLVLLNDEERGFPGFTRRILSQRQNGTHGSVNEWTTPLRL